VQANLDITLYTRKVAGDQLSIIAGRNLLINSTGSPLQMSSNAMLTQSIRPVFLGQGGGPAIFQPTASIYDFFVNANGTMTITQAPSISITGSLVGLKVGSLSLNAPIKLTAVSPAVTYPSINIVCTTSLAFSSGLVNLVGTTL